MNLLKKQKKIFPLIKCFFKEYLNPKKDNILRIKEINFINMHEKYQVKIDLEK